MSIRVVLAFLSSADAVCQAVGQFNRGRVVLSCQDRRPEDLGCIPLSAIVGIVGIAAVHDCSIHVVAAITRGSHREGSLHGTF